MVICLEQGADLHMAQLMLLPLTVSCFSKMQIGFTFLVLAHPGSHGKGPLNRCVCVCCSTFLLIGEWVLLLCVRFSFFLYQAKRLAWGNVSEMTYFVSSRT